LGICVLKHLGKRQRRIFVGQKSGVLRSDRGVALGWRGRWYWHGFITDIDRHDQFGLLVHPLAGDDQDVGAIHLDGFLVG
jgi:hypothetical protein